MKKILIGSILLMLILPFFATERKSASGKENFRLVNADKLLLSRQEDEQILELLGRVHFFYGKIEFKSDRALILDKQKTVRLFGNVRVSNDTLSVTSDTLAYYRIPEILNAGGAVLVTEKKQDGTLRWIRSEFATYNLKEEKITSWQSVRAYDLAENAYAECNYAFWDRKTGYAYLIEEPWLRTGKADTLTIHAEKMEFFDKDRKLIATFNVKVENKDYIATSDFLIYFIKEDKAVFTGEPLFKSDFATASSNEFYLYFKDRKLTQAELKDSCLVLFSEERKGAQTNWVKADFINIAFENDAIRQFSAEDRVSYYYYQPKGDKKDYLENEASGAFLEAKFKPDSKLETMRMMKGIRGKYKFQNNS